MTTSFKTKAVAELREAKKLEREKEALANAEAKQMREAKPKQVLKE